MKSLDLLAMADGIVATVKEYVGGIVTSQNKRLDEFGVRLGSIPAGAKGEQGDRGEVGLQGPAGAKGEQGDRGEVGLQGPAGAKGEQGEPGRDTDATLVSQLIEQRVTAAVAALPPPKQGETGPVGADGAAGPAGQPGREGKDGMPGRDGKDADPIHPDSLRLMVMQCAREIMAEVPKPQDGRSVDMDTLAALIDAKVVTAVAGQPKPGPGVAGKDADLSEVRRMIDAAVAEIRAEIPMPIAVELAANDDLADMADEILRGLNDDDNDPHTPAINVSVVHGMQGIGGGAGFVLSGDVSAQIEELKRVMLLPVIPVHDERGNFVGARRIDPNAAAA